MKVIEWMRSKQKSYWRKSIADRVVSYTFWVQERGLRSLFVGLVSGVIIVLFFRMVFTLIVVVAVLGTTVYLFAQDD